MNSKHTESSHTFNPNNQPKLELDNSPRWAALIIAIAISLCIFAAVGLAFDHASEPGAAAAAHAATAARNIAVEAAQTAP